MKRAWYLGYAANEVGDRAILIGDPFSLSSRGFGSNVSTCDGPPSM